MYAYCVIEYPIKSLDKMFTYKIPENLINKLKVGMKVLVPFNTQIVHGIVLRINNEYEDKYELKEIIRIEDEFLVLNKELLSLGLYLKETTLCNLITAYQTMLPSALKIKNQKSDYNYYEKYVLLNKDIKEVLEYIDSHRGKKVNILEQLLEVHEINKKELDSTSVRELERIGLVKIDLRRKYRLSNTKKDILELTLNKEQENAFNTILNGLNSNKTYLLYGVTGSGKTLVYINLIKEVIKNGKTAILLVPEISLTNQIINIFYNYFGDDVAILHSGLSKTEKYDEYVKILKRQVKIVIGTRSAIFAPLENIGIIIIDEEHSETYKQESNPRYYALDIAKKRCEYYKSPLVLGSATPSLESMARAKKGVYELLTLKTRANNQVLPEIKIVDMKDELAKRNFIISEELDNSIKECLKNKEQVILLLNRRGYSTIITCSNCGFTYKCPNCEISLTYHKSSNTIRCHYCGYTKIKDDICPDCHEKGLNYMGLGTEKLESIIKEKYAGAKVGRMDADTTANKGMHEKILKAFQNKEYDILIGTQMLSKGLDFPNCTLVGIINADSTLNIPDFRSNERTFALLSQASGRAGRGSKKGKVIIETFNPDNDTIKCVSNHDYDTFYEKEMHIRKILKYSPYYYLINIKVCSKDYKEARENATKIANYLKSKISSDTIILGPSTAINFYLKSIYRFSIIIKYRKDNNLKKTLKELDNIYATNKKVFLEIDLNPLQV
ncbi:MAG: primosomal protein N' [Ruminococcus sp.]|nr:primosomal protein N' [Ruminococcus sp.]